LRGFGKSGMGLNEMVVLGTDILEMVVGHVGKSSNFKKELNINCPHQK